MKLDHLAHSDERTLSLVPLGEVRLDAGSLVSVEFGQAGVMLRRESEAALLDAASAARR